MAESLSIEQRDFMAACEAEFADRFTERDENFQKVFGAAPSEPPVVDPWHVRGPRNGNQYRRDRTDRNDRRQHPYQRSDRSHRPHNHQRTSKMAESPSTEQRDFVAACESESVDRFTERDENFQKVLGTAPSQPPGVERNGNQYRRDRTDRNDRRQHPYERSDRSHRPHNHQRADSSHH